MLKMTQLSKIYRTEVVETYALRDFSIDVAEGSSSRSPVRPARARRLFSPSRACWRNSAAATTGSMASTCAA